MGLILRQSAELTAQRERFFYEIRDESGARHCHCGSETDRDVVLSQYPTFTAHKVSLPEPPRMVDVNAVEVEMEKALPQSDAVPLEL